MAKRVATMPFSAFDLEFSPEMFTDELGGECGDESPCAEREAEEDGEIREGTPDRNFEVGHSVFVIQKRGKGPVRPHGPGRITRVKDDGYAYSVKFTLGGKDKDIPWWLISEHDIFGEKSMIEAAKRASIGELENVEKKKKKRRVDSDMKTELTEADASTISSTESGPLSASFLRRSFRASGREQLSLPKVVALLNRLWKGDPNDKELQVLRLKNHIHAESNKQVLMQVLDALEKCSVVQVLYIQNMEKGMDDETLQRLSEVLAKNRMIWALNVGENFQVTRGGWTKFAESLCHTHITHLYAGSERTVYGQLKVRMRDIIRENREKHSMHKDPDNIEVISQVGQMWWNPRNAKCLQKYLPESAVRDSITPLVGRKINVFYEDEWRIGRIVKFNEGEMVHLIKWLDLPEGENVDVTLEKRGAFLRLQDHQHLISAGVAWVPKNAISNEKLEDDGKQQRQQVESQVEAENEERDEIEKYSWTPCAEAILEEMLSLPITRYFQHRKSWMSVLRLGPSEKNDWKSTPGFRDVVKNLEKGKFNSFEEFKRHLRSVFSSCVEASQRIPDDQPTLSIGKWAAEVLETLDLKFESVTETILSQRVPPPTKRRAKRVLQEMVPAQIFEHNQTMPEQLQEERENKERMCLVFGEESAKWIWFTQDELRPWRGGTARKYGFEDMAIYNEADIEHHIYELTCRK